MKQAIVMEQTSPTREQLVSLLPKLRLHAVRLTRSVQATEDLVQDTCLRAIDRLDQWQGEGRFEAWVTKIMVSIWFNEMRNKKRRREEDLEEAEPMVDTGVERGLIARFVLNKLHDRAVISDEDFSLIAKIYVYGFTYRELADDYGLPVGTLSSRVSRAKEALKTAVEGLERNAGA